MTDFVHLNVHSHYSILESTATVNDIIENAIADKQRSIALTDSGNMFGALEFYKACKWSGSDIKPIIGMRAYVAPESRFTKEKITGKKNFHHLILLAKNLYGYKNLIRLSSAGYLEGFYYKPRIDKQLLEEHKDGLIALSAGRSGEIGDALMGNNIDLATESAKFYKGLFGEDFYLEIHNHLTVESEELLEYTVNLSKELSIPIVATNNVHYVQTDYSKSTKKGEPDIELNFTKDDHASGHNVLMYIQNANSNNTGTFDIKTPKFGSAEFYLKTQKEMVELFEDYPEAIENTRKIADLCNIELDLKTNHMPIFKIPSESKSSTLTEYLRELVFNGLKEKIGEIPNDYKERADYEIKVIDNMGYPGYFLIVWDFIKAARDRGVSVGPGRGSAAGSLVAYALEITNVDPIKYDLLFERFLNPDRVSMPDVDIDFNDQKRDIVIDYVKKKYGEEAVAQIITFGKLTSKAALTDVGRVLGVELGKIKEITKKIPTVFGKVHTIKMSLDLPELIWLKDIIKRGNLEEGYARLNEDEQKYFDLIKYSLIVEHKVRNTGIHAAGVVIAPSDLMNYVPIHKTSKDKESSISIATQYAMNDLEDGGLLKMDFLGLKTLSIIDTTIDFMKANHKQSWDGSDWDDFIIDNVPLDDYKTYELFGDGNTLSVFQFESSGMQEYLKRLKPNNLEEITAMNALYRPGPMENIPEFIDRKFGRSEIEYLHPSMEDSLKTTYGIIVYQEQVMKLVQDVAGFSLGQADLLRRAMGKKKIKEMEKMKPLFTEGAKKLHGINEKLSDAIFELINKFANYGFNKSHSLAYSYLAYHTAWLKAHYPVEFIAANLTAEINDQEKIVQLRDEAKKFGIKLLPPDINQSNADFTVSGNKIYFGLAAIRNVGKPAVDSIKVARKEKKFTSFFDFVSRVDTRLINKRTCEALICAGAFDKIQKNVNRNSLLMSVDKGLEYAKSVKDASNMNMDSLFGGSSAPIEEPHLVEAQLWSETQRLQYEKEYLNFYISGHPIFKYEALLDGIPHIKTDFKDIDETQRRKKYRVCGVVNAIRKRLDKNNKPIAFVEIEDLQGKAEINFWSEEYEKFGHLIIQDEILIVEGSAKKEDENSLLKITANKVYDFKFNGEDAEKTEELDFEDKDEEIETIDSLIQRFATGYKVWIDLEEDKIQEKLSRIKNLLNGNGKSYIAYHVFSESNNYKNVYLSKDIQIPLTYEYFRKLIDIFGETKIRLLNYIEE